MSLVLDRLESKNSNIDTPLKKSQQNLQPRY